MHHLVAVLGTAGPWVFFFAMATLPAIGFPMFPFALSAGPLFGAAFGPARVMACCIGAFAVNSSLTYVLARGALQPLAERLVRRYEWRLPDFSRRGSWESALVVRLVPGLPYCVQGYALGLLRIPFRIYLCVSVGVSTAYLGSLILLSSGLATRDRPTIAAAGGLFLIAATGVALACRRLVRTKPWRAAAQ
jgi:uncharacterized membrane protein YdjX (TVP38/TMEM64 family)